MFGSADPPAPPPLPDPLPTPPSYAAGQVARPAGGKKPGAMGGTLMTGGEGVDSSTTNIARKSLLGQ